MRGPKTEHPILYSIFQHIRYKIQNLIFKGTNMSSNESRPNIAFQKAMKPKEINRAVRRLPWSM